MICYTNIKKTKWFCLLFSAPVDNLTRLTGLTGLSGPSRAEPSRAGPGRADPRRIRAGPSMSRAGPSMPGAEACRAELSRAGPGRAVAEPSRGRAEPSLAEPSRAKPSQGGPRRRRVKIGGLVEIGRFDTVYNQQACLWGSHFQPVGGLGFFRGLGGLFVFTLRVGFQIY